MDSPTTGSLDHWHYKRSESVDPTEHPWTCFLFVSLGAWIKLQVLEETEKVNSGLEMVEKF